MSATASNATSASGPTVRRSTSSPQVVSPRLVAEPYSERVERPARHVEVEVAVIGTGFAGLAGGAMLLEAGIDDFLIIDGAGGVGGVW